MGIAQLIVGIDGSDPGNYRGVYIIGDLTEPKRFYTGDVIEDWKAASELLRFWVESTTFRFVAHTSISAAEYVSRTESLVLTPDSRIITKNQWEEEYYGKAVSW